MMQEQANSKPVQSPPRIVRACRNQTLDRPPVWLMRQAGRYMAEYQAIRKQLSFLELCKSVDLATEVSLQPIRAFGMDAVIMFSDILIPVEAMGMPVVFEEPGGPMFPEPIVSAADVDRLIVPDPIEETGFVMAILKRLRQELTAFDDTGLIGFAGAPWTLASYMLEGKGSRNFTRVRSFMYNEPEAFHRLMAKLSQTITLYLNAQIEAGAQVVQLFDSWGGVLPQRQYREFVLPYIQQIIADLDRENAPVILFVKDSPHLLPCLAESGADVISLDEKTTLADARAYFGPGKALQGNLDFNALFAKPDVLQAVVESLIREGGQTGYIVNLSHGILPTTPRESVELVVDTVKQSARLFEKQTLALH